MIEDFEISQMLSALDGLAASSEIQRASDFPPEELRLIWEDVFVLFDSRVGEMTGKLAQEADAIRAFDDYLWSLPAEPDPMWHRDNLDKRPWPEIRHKASDLQRQLQA